MVLEFTVSPSGEVTMCRIVSSELNDRRAREEDRGARAPVPLRGADVETVTTTKPIDFFPA